jgi:hemolysin activation/secretion protein
VQPFVLEGVIVEGSTLPAAALEGGWRPLVGRTFSAADLVQITDALARVYERNDIAIYTLAIEAQDLTGGLVRVRAFEGYVEQVAITGPDGGGARSLVNRYVAQITTERPLRRSTLQRYVSLIRDIPGLNATAALANGAGDAGVILQLDLKARPVQAALAVNNRGTAFLGRTQVAADLYVNSGLRPGDQTRLSFAMPTDTKRFQYYAAQRSDPIGGNGLVASLNVSHLRTRPKGTDIRGHASAAGLQLSYPLLRSYERDVYATLGLDGVNNDNAFLGFTFADDRTRAVRAALAYSQQTSRRLAFASVTLSRGINGLGARTTDPGLGKPAFTKLNSRAGASFALGPQGALRINATGQLSADRLPATEQFSLGGDEFGRAFPAAIIAGDEGVAAVAELAYAPASLPPSLQGSEGYAFVDAGQVWYRARLGAPAADARVASAGVGLRAKLVNRVLIQLEAAKSLENPAPGFVDSGWRAIFALRSLF